MAQGRRPTEIMKFFNFPKAMVYRAANQFTSTPLEDLLRKGRKRHLTPEVRTPELVAEVEAIVIEAPETSMRDLADRLGTGNATIHRIVHKHLRRKSYKHSVRHALTEAQKSARKVKARELYDRIRSEPAGMIRFYSDEKIFKWSRRTIIRTTAGLPQSPASFPSSRGARTPLPYMCWASCPVKGRACHRISSRGG